MSEGNLLSWGENVKGKLIDLYEEKLQDKKKGFKRGSQPLTRREGAEVVTALKPKSVKRFSWVVE